jgi:DNA-binding response OmpR family regulator
MLIEDDQTTVSLLTTLLNLEGFMVTAPGNGHMDDYFNALLEEHPNVALIDVNLRIGSGLELLRKVRSAPEMVDTRILMISGLNVKEECLKAGADGFILKPFMPEELIKLIRNSVRKGI